MWNTVDSPVGRALAFMGARRVETRTSWGKYVCLGLVVKRNLFGFNSFTTLCATIVMLSTADPLELLVHDRVFPY